MPVRPDRPLEPPPGHLKTREGLRAGGAVLALIGGVCVVIAFVDFISAFASFQSAGAHGRAPTLFWLFFVGAPLLGLGLAMLKFGYMGVVAKYATREGAPAAAEGINRVGMGARPGIRAAASAAAAGMRDASASMPCPGCGEPQASDARFCNGCGAAMGPVCVACGAAGSAGARFCNQCGAGLG
ncbi:MAG: zinc ribbon domain-containing protein [Phycisphaerales bacterium]|nr:zinc ribbon domain-containing protein [Planctomycetota bacterium]MCH8509448.1 zinc ribbon domain-containing protein [Phycisphaerales bacterium]